MPDQTTVRVIDGGDLLAVLDDIFDSKGKPAGSIELDARVAAQVMIRGWIERGDGAAIYRNVDLGSRNLGEARILSFGSPAAQLEVDRVQDVPERMPDLGGQIGWRFQLEAVHGPAGLVGEVTA